MTDLTKFRKETEKLVRSVLTPNNNGLVVDVFEKEFRAAIGYPVPYRRLGYASCIDLIESMPEVVEFETLNSGHILLKAIPDKSTAHMTRLVASQRENTEGYNRRNADIIAQQGRRYAAQLKSDQKDKITKARVVPPFVKNQVKKLIELYDEEFDEGIACEDFGQLYNDEYRYRLDFQSYGFYNFEDFLHFGLRDVVTLVQSGYSWLVYPKTEDDNQRRSQQRERPTTSLSSRRPQTPVNDMVTEKMKENFKSILSQHPNGLPANQLYREYENLFGDSLEARSFGCQDMVEVCLWLPDVFKVQRNDDSRGDWMLYSTSEGNKSPEAIVVGFSGGKSCQESVTLVEEKSTALQENDCYLPIPAHIVSNVKRVLVRHAFQGLQHGGFRRAYLDAIGTNLDVRPLGFENLDMLLRTLEKMDILKIEKGGPNYIVKPSEKFMEEIEDTINGVPTKKGGELSVMSPTDKMEEQRLPEDLKIGSYLEVIVAEVLNPGRFFVQLRETSGQLEKMMDEMEEFYYHPESEKYRIPDARIVSGLICASIYSDASWHRAFVTSIRDLAMVEVLYVDYGTVARVKKDTLRFLDKKFSELPAQAIKARLHGIRPTEGSPRWPREATHIFLDLVKKTPNIGGMCAEVRGWDVSLKTLSLELVDTESNNIPEGIVVNKELVKMRLAEMEVVGSDNGEIRRKNTGKEESASPLRRPQVTEDNGRIEKLVEQQSMLTKMITRSDDGQFIKQLELVQENLQKQIHQILGAPKMVSGSQSTTVTRSQGYVANKHGDGKRIFVREMGLPLEATGHIINLDGQPWMTGREVSGLVRSWRGRDLLSRILKVKNITLVTKTVTSDSNPDLIDEMKKSGLTLKQDNSVEQLYMLSDVPRVLDMFGKDNDPALSRAIREEVDKFDPDEKFWFN